MPSSPYKVYYTIDHDNEGFTAWSDSKTIYVETETDDGETIFSEANIEVKIHFKKEAIASASTIILEEFIQIIPNLIDKTLSIKAPFTILKVTLFDALGREVLLKSKGFTNITVSHFSKGVYFVNVSTDKGSITKQIIIN